MPASEVFLAKSVKDMERAQAAFKKKELQAREGRQAMAEYEAAGQAMRERTAKLRALRLAKEAEDEVAAATAKPAPKAKGTAKARQKK